MSIHFKAARMLFTQFRTLAVALLVLESATGFGIAADVEITANTPNGVDLNTFVGTTAHVASGVAVGPLPSGPAVSATVQAWLLTNDGGLSAANTVNFTKGGTVTNNLGATITSTTSAIILGTTANGGVGTVSNAGTITGGSADAVRLNGGGSVTNLATGSITNSSIGNAVSISGGSTRTVINNGVISNTGTGFASGVLVQGAGATNTITNNAGGQISGGYNGIFASSTAALTLNNFGSISSTRGAAVEATIGGTLINTGSIASTNSDGILTRNTAAASVTNSGTITGAINAINFTATGAGSTGATHNLTLQTGSLLNGNVLGGSGTDNLILNGTGTETIAKFLNFETLSMQGSDWTLSGTGTFATGTTVQSGTLRVNGQLTSPAIGVQSGATLTGNGTVVGTVTNAAGGNVQVGNGTLTVNGNYVHQNGAFFTVGVTPSTNGMLAITGAGHTATLSGGTVQVLAGVGNYAPNTTYTILSASGGRTGTFGDATTNLAFFTPSLAYDSSNVYLTLVRNSIDFSTIGGTPNQISAGRGVEALGIGNAITEAALLLTADQARAAFDSVSGEIHPSLLTLMLNDSRFVRDAIFERQRQASGQLAGGAMAWARGDSEVMNSAVSGYATTRKTKAPPKWPIKAAPPVMAPVFGTWVQGYGNWARVDGNGNAATLRSNTGGAIAGLDMTFANNWRVGVATGGGRSEARVDPRVSSGTIDTFHVAAYGGGHIGDIALRTGAAYSHHDVATSRIIAFPGSGDFAAAKYGASTSQVFGEAAYRLGRNATSADLFANIAHVRVHSDGFGETGGPAALNVAQADTSSTFTTLGARAQAPIGIIATSALTAKGVLGWQHAFDATAPVSLMSFATSPSPFAITGVPIAADSVLVEAGLDAALPHDMVVGLLYSSRLASTASDHALKANFGMRF